MHIEITLPVLNEANTLKLQIQKIMSFFKSDAYKHYSVSFIIADNGSTDETRKIAQDLCKNNRNLKYIYLTEKGVGRALKKSWGESEADVVGYMDLDLATDMYHLEEVFKAFNSQDIDIVYGSRLHKNSRVIGRSLLRETVSRAFNIICKVYMQTSFSDGMCGFKFLKRSIYPELNKYGAINDGWFFSTELLIVAEKLGYKLYELPVQWTDDPNSKVKIVKLSIEYLKSMHALKALYPEIKRKQ